MIYDNFIRKAKVLYIVDGDTLDVELDLGYDPVKIKKRIRLKNINTPERGQAGYQEAKKYLIDTILYKDVFVESIKTKTDTFKKDTTGARYEGYIHVLNSDGTTYNLNDKLVELGLAVVMIVQ